MINGCINKRWFIQKKEFMLPHGNSKFSWEANNDLKENLLSPLIINWEIYVPKQNILIKLRKLGASNKNLLS